MKIKGDYSRYGDTSAKMTFLSVFGDRKATFEPEGLRTELKQSLPHKYLKLKTVLWSLLKINATTTLKRHTLAELEDM